MRILFDQGTPVPLRQHLTSHVVDTAFGRGWSTLANGELLDVAEQEGYDLLITTDQQLHDQQHFADRRLAILVLLSTSWPRIQLRMATIQAAVEHIVAGGYQEIAIWRGRPSVHASQNMCGRHAAQVVAQSVCSAVPGQQP